MTLLIVSALTLRWYPSLFASRILRKTLQNRMRNGVLSAIGIKNTGMRKGGDILQYEFGSVEDFVEKFLGFRTSTKYCRSERQRRMAHFPDN